MIEGNRKIRIGFIWWLHDSASVPPTITCISSWLIYGAAAIISGCPLNADNIAVFKGAVFFRGAKVPRTCGFKWITQNKIGISCTAMFQISTYASPDGWYPRLSPELKIYT
jgi:hypothetical protein